MSAKKTNIFPRALVNNAGNGLPGKMFPHNDTKIMRKTCPRVSWPQRTRTLTSTQVTAGQFTVGCAMYGRYDGNRSYTSVATEHVYGYARGQYSTALLGTGVQTHMAQTSTHTHVQTNAQHNSTSKKEFLEKIFTNIFVTELNCSQL